MLARQAEAGLDVSALGMFDQGFYDTVGFGTGSYENWINFDPATLQITDPVSHYLDDDCKWQGIAGHYIIELGPESSATTGESRSLPTLKATVNAFSRMWFGVRPASSLAITDQLQGEETLLQALDDSLRMPMPHFGWVF